MGFDATKQLSFPCLASILLMSRAQQFFLTKGLCYPSVEDDKRVKRSGRASVKWSKERVSSSNVMDLFLKVGSKNNSCIRETQENSIENSSTNWSTLYSSTDGPC